MNKPLLLFLPFVFLVCCVPATFAQKTVPPRICGDPEAACKGRSSFQSYELPVIWPKKSVIAESRPFYAIILKSAKFDFNSNADCNKVYTDDEIQRIQTAYPNNKVFALKCQEPGMVYYKGIENNVVFIAIYAGNTLAVANRLLRKVKRSGEFPGIMVRKLRAGVNGT